MRGRLAIMVVGVLAAAHPIGAQDGPAVDVPALDAASFERWLGYLQPSATEQRWTDIPWRPQLWTALREAQAAEKPVLVWAMNGHPCACT